MLRLIKDYFWLVLLLLVLGIWCVMPQVRPDSIDNMTLVRPTSDWAMDQQTADELQRYPQYPLLFGVDGRFTGTMRRFRGFKRLDFDIRTPWSNVGHAHPPVIHHGIGGYGPNTLPANFGGQAAMKSFAPHTWDGTSPDDTIGTIDPENSTIYQFVAGTLDLARRTEGMSDRRPVSVFIIHFLDSSGKPCVKLLARPIGKETLDSLWQCALIGEGVKAPTEGDSQLKVLDLRLRDTLGNDIDWVGIGLIGRFIVLSHKKDKEGFPPGPGKTWLYDVPYKAWRGLMRQSSVGANIHDIENPESEFPAIDNGFMHKGDKIARCKVAGTRDFSWFHDPGTVNESEQIISPSASGSTQTWIMFGSSDRYSNVAYPFNDATYMIGNIAEGQLESLKFSAFLIPADAVITSVNITLRARYSEGAFGSLRVRAALFDFVADILGDRIDTKLAMAGATTVALEEELTSSFATYEDTIDPPDGTGVWTRDKLESLYLYISPLDLPETPPWEIEVSGLSITVNYQTSSTRDGALRFEGHNTNLEGQTKHAPNSRFRARIRLVNYTTGFVSPISEPLQLVIGPNREGVLLSWVPGERNTDFDEGEWVNKPLGAGGVKLTPETSEIGAGLLASVFGVESRSGAFDTKTGRVQPNTIDLEGVYDVRLQIWVTQSVPLDNPSGGGGYYFLDQEIPVVYRNTIFAESDIPSPLLWPGWVGDPRLGEELIGRVIPSKSNDELATAPIYLPEADDVGDLEPSTAFGNVTGVLVSMSDGGKLTTAEHNAASGDIKASPPWKFYPGGWIEATAPLFRHPIYPKPKQPPRFVNIGDILFFVSQNRLVRIVRDGTTLMADDVDISGGVNIHGVTGAGNGIVIVTSTGLEELNPVTLGTNTVQAVQRIISEKWQSFARRGDIMSGYDPQLKAIFVAPRRTLTSTEWMRSEALVIWLTTGRITMLSDIYWCGMSRGVHPVTGKEHLFFIDPAHNITYADDSIDDEESHPATMVGINKVSMPAMQRNQSVFDITVTIPGENPIPEGATIVVDGVPFQEGTPLGWLRTGTAADVAESIRDAINNWVSLSSSTNIDEATNPSAGVVRITSRLHGAINDEFNYVSTLNVTTTHIVVTQVTPGENQIAGTLMAGGAFQGRITQINVDSPDPGLLDIVGDPTLTTSNDGQSFDQYAFYNPHTKSVAYDVAGGIQPRFSALIGAQLYVFRLMDDGLDGLRPALVADVRIRDNGYNNLVVATADITFYNGATSIAVGDHYCVSPVVMQIVGAPLDTSDFAGSGIDVSGAIESLAVVLRNRKGTAKYDSTRLPQVTVEHPVQLQGALFLGVASIENLASRPIGFVVKPNVDVGVVSRLDGSDGSAGISIWDEEKMEVVTAGVNKSGNSLFPVITHYGTDYQFDVVMIMGRTVRSGKTSGKKPEGISR